MIMLKKIWCFLTHKNCKTYITYLNPIKYEVECRKCEQTYVIKRWPILKAKEVKHDQRRKN